MPELIDLSHPITNDMPLFPGTPPIKVEQLHTVEKDGFAEKRFLLTTHVGTHLDAPAHMLAQGKTVDQFALEKFWGTATVVDVSRLNNRQIPHQLVLEALERQPVLDFLLFFTGFGDLWGQDEYFGDFPVLSEQATKVICQSKLKGIGLDAPSVDAMEVEMYRNHLQLFNADKIIIENMTNLKQLINTRFRLAVFPLKVAQADGMPVRAVAILK